MRQKLTITLSVLLLALAVFLIARDLFRKPVALTDASCCGDDLTVLKQIDTSLIGYTRIGIIGTGVNGLTGITVTDDNRVFACGNRRVVVFDTAGNASGGFPVDTVPSCIAYNGSEVFLGLGREVAVYSFNGKKISRWKVNNPEGFITSLAFNRGYLYAADAVSKIILKYSPDGKIIQELGRKDTITDAPGFVIPSMYFDIGFGGFNDLWAVNPGRLRIENYTTSGQYQSGWGIATSDNSGFTGCCNPAHFTILPDGGFVTYEKGVDKIKLFDVTGRFICFVAGAGSFKGSTDFQINGNLVKDMAAGSDGLIYILDAYSQISIFRKKDL